MEFVVSPAKIGVDAVKKIEKVLSGVGARNALGDSKFTETLLRKVLNKPKTLFLLRC